MVIDITYISMEKGFMYLVAIIDLYSRYTVNWSVSNSMDADWCKETLEEAIQMCGNPEIINTDLGSQFTSQEFSCFVLDQGIRLSMDGKRRATDNPFIERLWRNIKYLNPPKDGLDLYLMINEYFNYYNNERRHESLNYEKPVNWYQALA